VNGVRAERLLKDLVQAFIDAVMERDLNQLTRELKDLEDQLKDFRTTYNTVRRDYDELAKAMEVDPMRPLEEARGRSGDPVLDRLEGMRDEKENLDVQIKAAVAEEALAAKNLDDEPEFIPEVVTDAGVTFAEQIAMLEIQRRNLEEAQRRYKPAHSSWRALDEQIREIGIQIEQLKDLATDRDVRNVNVPNPAIADLRAALREASMRLESLRTSRAALNDKITRLAVEAATRLEQYSELMDLHADKVNLRKILNEKEAEKVKKGFAVATLKNTYDLEGRPYEVVKPPLAPAKPETPNPWIIALFSALAGLALGGALALAAEYGRNSYRSVGDVASVMAVPVLGAINTIVTTGEARRAQMLRAFVGLSSAVILGGLVWFTWIWAHSPERLPTEVLQAIDDFRRMLM